MKSKVIRRPEMMSATLDLGGLPIDLSEYATTGLLALAVGPRGYGKTNAGLLVAEQLSVQGWVSVLIDPENELESMYGAADKYRKPLFVFVDEGQLFSAARNRKNDLGEAADIINDFAGRGRKRALDLFITTLRYTGTIHRSLFSNKNLTLIGCQEDPTAWSGLAPQCRASGIEFNDLNALSPGEFICFSRRGVEKVRMPMAVALKKVALKAKAPKKTLPATFSQWNRAMMEIPKERLLALSDPVVNLLGAVCGLSVQQMIAGQGALHDEIAARP